MLAAVTSWWLVLIGAAAVAAAWFYTGGSRPYGYRALGEVAVFLFFGVAAVTGTAYVQMGTGGLAGARGVRAGRPARLRAAGDQQPAGYPSDALTSKRTLAVVLGDQRTRLLYLACVLLPFCAAAAMAVAAPLTLLTLAALPFALAPIRLVTGRATGPQLITALAQTGRLQLAFGALLTLGLAIRP